MTGRPDGPERVSFGRFAFDPRTLELLRDGTPVPLEPLPSRILARLLETPGLMVTREELRELGWPKLPGVADDSLNTCIRQIRDALGDDARVPSFVETLRGRGYRFTADLRRVRTQRAARRAHPLGWAALGAAAAAAVLLVSSPSGEASGPGAVPPDARELLARIDWAAERSFDWSVAMALADSAVRAFPDVAGAHARHAELSLVAARAGEARRSVRTALALDPDETMALRVHAHLEMLEGRWETSADALERARRADPDDPRTWVALAYRHTVLGEPDPAAAAIARALELDPLSPLVIGDAGLMHLWAGRWSAATEACARAVEVEPRATWAIGCAFDAARLGGDAETAARWADRWLDAFASPGPRTASTEDPVARVLAERERMAVGKRGYSVAQALAEVGRTAEALDALEDAVARPGLAVLGVAVDPRLRPLRGEPRYRKVLSALGLAGVASS